MTNRMNNNHLIMSLVRDDDVLLEIPQSVKEKHYNPSQIYPTPRISGEVYLNRVCQTVIFPYIEENYPHTRINENEVFWSFGISGITVNLEQKKLIIITSSTFDTDEFRVPQELIDIPSLSGDYYLAAQIDLEENFIRLWGYTTHKKLKQKANYTFRNRTYYIESDDLINDISVLWTVLKFCPDELTRTQIEPITNLTDSKAQDLIKKLGNPDLIFPRRELEFETWATLLQNEKWRTNLYNLRLGKPQESESFVISTWNEIKINIEKIEDIIEEKSETIWKIISDFLNPEQMKFSSVRVREKETKENSENEWIVRGTKLNDISSVLLVWLKQNTDSWDLFVQLYTYEEQLLDGIQLSLLSDDDEETCVSYQNHCLQSDEYTFEVGELPQLEIKYKDFHFIPESKYLIP